MSSDESEIEMHSALPSKSTKKTPRSPSEDVLSNSHSKKTTKNMIHEALSQLKTRKGVSLYAIKKYMNEKYNLDTEKTKYLIKKQIKNGVEDGSIIQMKGVGASGSFKLAPVKEIKKKPKKKPVTSENAKKSMEKIKKSEVTKKSSEKMKKLTKVEKSLDKSDKSMEKVVKPKSKNSDENEVVKKKKVVTKVPKANKKEKIPVDVGEKGKKDKVKMTKGSQTPAKKRAIMMKRKSIGSIIKPPKMKPKAKG